MKQLAILLWNFVVLYRMWRKDTRRIDWLQLSKAKINRLKELLKSKIRC